MCVGVRQLWSSGKTLAANGGGRGFKPEGTKNLFFTFYSIRVECEELFCKNNIILVRMVTTNLFEILDYKYITT